MKLGLAAAALSVVLAAMPAAAAFMILVIVMMTAAAALAVMVMMVAAAARFTFVVMMSAAAALMAFVVVMMTAAAALAVMVMMVAAAASRFVRLGLFRANRVKGTLFEFDVQSCHFKHVRQIADRRREEAIFGDRHAGAAMHERNGRLLKQVRIARHVEYGLDSRTDHPESPRFIDENVTYRDFLAGRGFVCEKGNFVDLEGNVLGQHGGIMNYTVGQRKGLGIALGKPAFVVKINAETGEVVLGENRDLFSACVKSTETVFTCDKLREEAKSEAGLHVKAKIRYASKPADAVVRLYGDGRAVTTFTEPQRAATPGQSVVFYKGELLAGGGVIE